MNFEPIRVRNFGKYHFEAASLGKRLPPYATYGQTAGCYAELWPA
jgi:hypothetical protein